MLDLEKMLRASLDHAEARANETGSEIIMIGILPTLRTEHFESEWMSANPRYQALDEAVFAARREDLELDITGPRSRAPEDVRRHHRAGVGLHVGATAPAGVPRRLPGHLERRAGAGRPADGARRELAVPVRQTALGRDPDRTVPAGHRHPLAGAAEPGRPAAGVLRRAVDHLDLRPVRGERPVLPGAAAGDHRRGPGGRAGVRQGAAAAGTAAAQRHRLPVEPAGLRRRRRPTASAGGEPGAAGRARPSSTCWPTPLSTTAR